MGLQLPAHRWDSCALLRRSDVNSSPMSAWEATVSGERGPRTVRSWPGPD